MWAGPSSPSVLAGSHVPHVSPREHWGAARVQNKLAGSLHSLQCRDLVSGPSVPRSEVSSACCWASLGPHWFLSLSLMGHLGVRVLVGRLGHKALFP